jgi:hypothetical protein
MGGCGEVMRFVDEYKRIPLVKRHKVQKIVHRHIEVMLDEIAKVFFNKKYMCLGTEDMSTVYSHIKFFVKAYGEDWGEEWDKKPKDRYSGRW